MLTISKPLSAGQAQTYHKKEFTSKEQSYWARGQEVQGEWQGRLSEKYGLAGAVGNEEFARLSDGQHPLTGEQLVRHRSSHQYEGADGKTITTAEHRAGWDATFSAPKSVSLTALVGGDMRVREAHRESVRTALDELERYTQARIGGNHLAETTGKFAVAKFEHDTARPVDGYAAPQLHTHAVIFNLTELDNGQTRALQPQSLFASQQFATAVYQSGLTYRLARLGYELEAGRSGAPEIKGYSQEYLDASSPRSQQIRAHLEKVGLSSKESAEIAAHSTRDKKQILTPAEVLSAHRHLAAEFGNQADRVVADARARTMEQRQPANSAVRAQEAVTFSRDKHFEREAVVDERLLMRDALRRGMGKTTYNQVHQNFERRFQKGEFLAVSPAAKTVGRLFTTPETISAERGVIQRMRAGQGQAEPILSTRDAVAVTNKHTHLNAAQTTAIEHVLTSRDRVQGIQGVAGAGKTTALDVIRVAAESSGYTVEGFAPTSRAAKQLGDAGILAGTLQGFLARGDSSGIPPLDQKRLYFVDESSLTSTNQMKEFLDRLTPKDRVILVGDVRQHQAIEAGRPFEQLQNAGMSTAKLDQIVRQRNSELKTAVEYLARGDVSKGIRTLRLQGRVHEISAPAERVRAIAKDFAEDPTNTLVVSPDNASRRELNNAIRTQLQSEGLVGTDNHMFRVLVQQQDMTGADRRWVSRYAANDQLRYSRGSNVGIERGSYARVVSTDLENNLLTVEAKGGDLVTYDPRRLNGVSIYREIEQPFAVGDRLQFTAPDKTIGVANRELGTIQDISTEGTLTVRLENGRIVEVNPAENRHFDHGYAVTSHSAQGLTADRVLINVDTSAHPDLVNSRFAYVSVSRAQHDAQIYTNDAGSLEARLGNDVSKSSAIEFSQSASQVMADLGRGQSI
jgi:conjugative relaxase-like TrwC/TraI family protein